MFPWEMDVDGEPSGAPGEMDDLENYAFEHESCGICRDVIIDRGVLDCCQHWFCYTCIDNWAAITNRCPLCKSEFQHITCTPVYGTMGNTNEDEYSLTSGDDDWYVQEEGSALSFPSYYIDAEAVVCLDVGDCKIRSGLVAAEDDSTLDTSIACDSCDIWYHAICVGFNPDMTSENSWLCPRCMSTKVKHEEDVILKENFSEECVIGSDRTSSDASFSGRVSVSVADEGETALVVSMVGVHSETRGGLSEASLSFKTAQEAFNCSSYPSHSKDGYTDTVANATILRNTDSFNRSCNKSSEINVVCTVSSEPTEGSLEFSPMRESSTTLFSSEQGNMLNEQLEMPKLVSSYSMGTKNAGENAAHKSNNQISPAIKSSKSSSPACKMVRLTDIDVADADAVQQMKTAQDMQLLPRRDEHKSSDVKEREDVESGNEVNHPTKKAKLEVQAEGMNLLGNSGVSLTDSHTTSSSAKDTVDDMPEFVPQHKSVPDIMSIVEGEDYIRDPGRQQAKPVGRRAGDKHGLRVKKIFRKEEGKESAAAVQKLQQEIREVVRDTGTNILEKNGSFDEKLLTAFRAAIGKSVDGPAESTNHSLIRTRRSLLQKGKKRENLTKKLYGTSTGRRSAWHRDWEVEFWKYRCSPGINPEKIETLQSVLQLLKKSSEMDMESAQGKKAENNNSILTRLYLADASVVPRKDDIKPLSALAGCTPLDNNSQIKANNSKSPNKPGAGTETVKINSPSNIGKVSSSSILNKEASSRRENRNNQPSQNPKNQSAGDIKQDKRKWALEILARKNASSVTSKDHTGDTDALKGSFPLLAQLPADMRPQLAAGRNNKVPISVRQAQLHRIAEHYLQKANLDVIRKCADTELAIADAVNIEKDIYERSNSKSVYVNLCSQATRQPAKGKSDIDDSTVTEKTEVGSDLISQVRSDNPNISGSDMEEAVNRAVISDEKSELDVVPEQTVHKHTVSFSSAEEALRKAGLFDSPPNSPESKTMAVEGNSDSMTVSSCPKFSQEEAVNRAVISDKKSELDVAPEQTVHKHTVSLSSAEEALRKAGLFNSPPNSPASKTMAVERNSDSMTVSSCPKFSQGKCLSVKDTLLVNAGECSLRCNVDLSSEPSQNLQLSPNSMVKDISSLKDDKSSVPNDAANCQNLHTVMPLPCQQPQTNSEHQKLIAGEETKDTAENGTSAVNLAEDDSMQCEKSSGPGKEIAVGSSMPDKVTGHAETSSDMEKPVGNLPNRSPRRNGLPREGEVISKPKNLEPSKEKSSSDNPSFNNKRPKGEKPTHETEGGGDSRKPAPDQANKNTSDSSGSIYKKVEMFVKEHIRPLCKSGVITVDQYRWAVAKTTDKVMNFHRDAKSANFLIKEGDKVKRLALQYVEAAQQKVN